MKNFLTQLTFLILIFLFNTMATAQENNVRPVRDDVGFCWRASEMDALMEYLSANTDVKVPDNGLLIRRNLSAR